MTFVVGPEAHQVFFKGSDEELSPKEAYQFVVPVFGKNVVYDSPISMMYEQLAFIKSGLMVNQLKRSVPIIEKEAREYFEKWGNKGEIDMLDAMNNLTILTASRCLLGREIREDPKVGGEFARLYHDLEGGLNPISFFFPHFPMPAHWKRDAARIEVSKLFSKIIKERRQNPDEKHEDMLQILMDCQYKNGEAVTDDAIAGMLIGILFAGQHTSGITSTWTGFHLCKHPEYRKELLEEQKRIIAEFGEEITFDSLKASVFLEGCVRESLRLFPPLIFLMRKVMTDLHYKEYTIPAGDLLCVAPSVAMRLPHVFPNPDTFDPHRFERKEYTSVPYSYLAFGGGRHGCPGENFGIMQIKTIWTVLLRTFDFELDSKEFPAPDYTNLVVGPKQPCKLRYTRKQSF
jgi:sterol 14-demethylase